MLDIKIIRENPETIKKACQLKNVDPKLVDQVLNLDQTRKKQLQRIEAINQQRNKLSSHLKSKPDKNIIEQGKKLKKELQELKTGKQGLGELTKKLTTILAAIPNPPASDVQPGKDEKDNQVIKIVGQKTKFTFPPLDHLSLAEKLDLIDVKRAAKIAGTRFGYLKNEAVLLELALVQYGLSILIKEGFIPVIPPVLTKVSVFHKLGYSQHGGNEDYYLVYDPKKENPQEESNFYLIGTAEHALVPLHQGEVLTNLPKRYVGFSPAFRREAGSWGKDTRGIFRVHQFDKLEMVCLIEPQEHDDQKEHDYLLSLAEKIVQGLDLPYQIVKMCTGDLGHPAARKYDIECWFPAAGQYRETHSISTCTDFQSRALDIRYQTGSGKLEYVHVLNGTAIAVGRTILAILENYQQKDGSIIVPKVLQPYLGNKIIKPSGQ